MNGILFWIVPPLAGAIIGYVTNFVAIKMLFRPLREIRVFGLRLPFTPGILPRERHKLANSIGRMVEQELITPGVLRERLGRKDVRERIETAIGSYSGNILDRPLSYWLEEKPGEIPLAGILKDFFYSDVFNSYLDEILKIWIVRNITQYRKNNFGSWLKFRLRDFGEHLVPPARDMIKHGLIREMKKQTQGGSSYRKALERIIEKYPGISLREFLSLGEQNKILVDSFLSEKAANTMDDNIENALSSTDLKLLVSDRINSLDMLRVEKIILDIMAGQLKWINVFGGILGALIGFVQVILNLFLY